MICFAFCGGARTFEECFEQTINKVILHSYSKNDVVIFLYLKTFDPGEKDQYGWNFTYINKDKETLQTYIKSISKKYAINIIYYLLEKEPISGEDLYNSIFDKTKYVGFYSTKTKFDNQGERPKAHLIRGMYMFHNLESVGYKILEYEKKNNVEFSHYVFIRPDLLFHENLNMNIENTKTIVSVDNHPDYFIKVKQNNFIDLFLKPMLVLRQNNSIIFGQNEHIFSFCLKNHNVIQLKGSYALKRHED